MARVLNLARERSFTERAKRLAGETVLLYGAGAFGKEMLRALREAGADASAFLDRAAAAYGSVEGIPAYTAEEAPFDGKRAVVIFCVVMDKAERHRVLNWLAALGYARVIEGQSLRCLQVQPDDRREESVRDYYAARAEKIQRAASLFADEWSRNLYWNVALSHASGDYSACERWESPMAEQYFPPDLALSKGYSRFIDCGAYTGDTAQALLERNERVEAYAGFEPDGGNYIRMAERLETLGDRIESRFLFPCAAAETTAIRRFRYGNGSGSLSGAGEGVAQAVALDEAIPDFRPTFLKMDIEGAEPQALQGARSLIARNAPDLAVCVYHAVNHIWDIPLSIDSWNLGYRFYLRSYNAYAMETVLYAVGGKGGRNA